MLTGGISMGYFGSPTERAFQMVYREGNYSGAKVAADVPGG